MNKKIGIAFLATFLLILTACRNEQSSSPSIDAGLIDIGAGRKIYLECSGTGSPTVVFISGRTDRGTIWKSVAKNSNDKMAVYPAVAKFTHVCAYDRPGTFTFNDDDVVATRSTPVNHPITPKDGVEDLHALLTGAKVPGPYVLVAHSYGGLIARLYTSTYPTEVVGLVLVDSLTEFLVEEFSETETALWIRLNSNYSPELDKFGIQERTDFLPSFEQLRNAASSKKIPTLVLTSDQPMDFKGLMTEGVLPADTPLEFGPKVYQAHLKGQDKLTRLTNGRQITQTHAGHYVHTEQPQLVIDAISDVVDQVRNSN